jgi:hypothetical protein
MRNIAKLFMSAVLLVAAAAPAAAQDEPEAPSRGPRTMKPVIMGQKYAVSSMNTRRPRPQ